MHFCSTWTHKQNYKHIYACVGRVRVWVVSYFDFEYGRHIIFFKCVINYAMNRCVIFKAERNLKSLAQMNSILIGKCCKVNSVSFRMSLKPSIWLAFFSRGWKMLLQSFQKYVHGFWFQLYLGNTSLIHDKSVLTFQRRKPKFKIFPGISILFLFSIEDLSNATFFRLTSYL